MKLLAFLMSISITSFGQKDFVWSEVVKVDSTIQAKDLYSRAKLWVASVYNSGKAATQLMDDNSFTIVVKGAHEIVPEIQGMGAGFSSLAAGWVNYTLIIVCKDGRFKYTIDNCIHEGRGVIGSCGSLTLAEPAIDVWKGGMPTKFWTQKLKPDFISNTDKLIERLKEAMLKKSDKGDW